MIYLFLAAFLILLASCCSADSCIHGEDLNNIPVFGYEIVNSYPHDTMAFTQGLFYDRDDLIYEGTGLYGRSGLRKVELKTGRVIEQISLPGNLFGEGIALWEDSIIQLTWQSRLGMVYNKENLTETGRFEYRTEGWGLTGDKRSLIMSDGSSTLFFLDPVTFEIVREVSVSLDRLPVTNINELEYIRGEVYANIWLTNTIMRIDPNNGEVLGTIDLAGLLPGDPGFQNADVLNGIAYDPMTDRLFVTGKFWPWVFEIKLINK